MRSGDVTQSFSNIYIIVYKLFLEHTIKVLLINFYACRSYALDRELTPMCDLWAADLSVVCDTLPYHKEHLCKVILINLYVCRSYAPNRDFQLTFKCELDLWAAESVVRNTPSHHVIFISNNFVIFHRKSKIWPGQIQTYAREKDLQLILSVNLTFADPSIIIMWHITSP